MIEKRILMRVVSLLLIMFLMQSCIVLPKTVPRDDQECLLLTKSMTIDYYTSPDMIDEAVDEMVHALASDCHEPECLLLFAPLVAISAGSLVVSGSIVVAGNTIHWIEKQGRCDDSITQQAITGLITSIKNIGGSVINTSTALIEWFKKQTSSGEPPDENAQKEHMFPTITTLPDGDTPPRIL